MQHPSRRTSRFTAIAAVVAILSLSVAPAAFGDAWARDGAADAAVQQLDPAFRTAIVARTADVTATSPSAASVALIDEDEFAWGAAALGLGAGVAAMCLLLGCVTLARSHGRLRSV